MTTNSRLLTTAAAAEIEQALSAEVSLISLQQFDTGKIGFGSHRNLSRATTFFLEITRVHIYFPDQKNLVWNKFLTHLHSKPRCKVKSKNSILPT